LPDCFWMLSSGGGGARRMACGLGGGGGGFFSVGLTTRSCGEEGIRPARLAAWLWINFCWMKWDFWERERV
jgi:hypothetical protein